MKRTPAGRGLGLAIAVTGAALAWPVAARAGGFELIEQSPAGTGMCGAFSAKADDPSAIFYNAAGIAAQEGSGVLIGASLAFVGSEATAGTPPVTTSSKGGPTAIPYGYLTSHIGRRLAVGVGLFTQFGASLEWESTKERPFPGRFVARNTQLQSVTIDPTVAYRPFDALSIGFGVDVVLASATLARDLHVGDAEPGVLLGGTARAIGFNVGMLAEVLPGRLSAAVTYRSGTDLDFDMKAHFSNVPPELSGTLRDQPARVTLSLPHNITFGIAVRPIDALTLTADVHYTLWSSFATIGASFPTGNLPALQAPQNWRDTVSLRAGGEYLWRSLALRIGLGYDLTPIPESTLGPTAPGMDRFLISAGVGWSWRSLTVAAAYIAGIAGERSSALPDFQATYSQTIHLVTLGVSYRLPSWSK